MERPECVTRSTRGRSRGRGGRRREPRGREQRCEQQHRWDPRSAHALPPRFRRGGRQHRSRRRRGRSRRAQGACAHHAVVRRDAAHACAMQFCPARFFLWLCARSDLNHASAVCRRLGVRRRPRDTEAAHELAVRARAHIHVTRNVRDATCDLRQALLQRRTESTSSAPAAPTVVPPRARAASRRTAHRTAV